MSWEAYAIITWFVVNLIVTIATIGRSFPVTRATGITNLFVYAFLVWAVVRLDGAS